MKSRRAPAATYAVGLAKYHGYIDGNKCVAFMTLYVFLGLNGRRLVAPEPEVVEVMTDVAVGRLASEHLAGWMRDHLQKIE